MKGISSKKWYCYISIAVILCYAIFVMFAYHYQFVPELCSLDVCRTYYMFTYMGLSAVAYVIDCQSRKEPGFLLLFCIPIYSAIFLFLCMLLGGCTFSNIAVMILVIALVVIADYFAYKYLMVKILSLKHGYQAAQFVYVILQLTIVLLLGFHFLG